MKNNDKQKIENNGMNNRMIADKISIRKQTRVGVEHSLTLRESKSKSKLMMYEFKCKFNNIKLIDKTKSDWFYCIAEDGTVFKFSKDYYNFYYLDLDKFVWRKKPSLYELISDSFLKYQEFVEFKDYFSECNE